jgi:hypothetical protein
MRPGHKWRPRVTVDSGAELTLCAFFQLSTRNAVFRTRLQHPLDEVVQDQPSHHASRHVN